MRLARRWRFSAAGAALLALGVLVYLLAEPLPAHHAHAQSNHPSASAPYRTSGPSIVLILTDDQRWDTMWAMPTVQHELIAHGVRFENAFLVNPLCCPSRTTILTGEYSHSTKVYSDAGPYGGFHAFHDGSTIATWLRAGGYHTALFGKYLNEYTGTYIPPGWDRWFAYQQPPGYFNYRVNDQGILRSFGSSPADYSTDVLARQASSFIRSTQGPLFVDFAPFAPHFPGTPPPRYAHAFSTLRPFRPPSYDEADTPGMPAYVQARPRFRPELVHMIDDLRRDQYRALLGVDDAVREIIDALRATGRLHSTMIVLMSDNGQTWGEHRFPFDKQIPYEESIRTPMVVRYDPVVHRPRPDAHLVLNLDVAQTFAGVAGVSAPGAEGMSLLPLLANPTIPWRTDFLIEHLVANGIPTYCAVRNAGYIYVDYSTGERELYDLRADPYELDNRAYDPAYASIEAAMRARLLQLCNPPPPGFTPG